jgi:hypothetical protein
MRLFHWSISVSIALGISLAECLQLSCGPTVSPDQIGSSKSAFRA